MLDRLKAFADRLRADEKLVRRIYIGCTVLALAGSVGILAAIAHGERRQTTDAAAGPTGAALMPPPALASSAPDEGEDLPLTVEIDDEQATALIKIALRGRLKADELAASFNAPDKLKISAVVDRDAVRDYLREEGQSAAATIIAIAPDTLAMELELGISADGGGLKLGVRSFSACGLPVGEYLPESLLRLASEAMNSALPDTSVLRSVEVRDGSAVLTLGL